MMSITIDLFVCFFYVDAFYLVAIHLSKVSLNYAISQILDLGVGLNAKMLRQY